jgi:hypothetical protein
MNNEIDYIVRGFRANLAQEILFHRTIDGAGVVSAFVSNVRRQRERVLTKLEDMRAQSPGEALEGAATVVNDLADAVVARVVSAGRVEFADGAI